METQKNVYQRIIKAKEPYSISILRNLYLSGAWLDVDLGMDNEKKCVEKRLDSMLKMCYLF